MLPIQAVLLIVCSCLHESQAFVVVTPAQSVVTTRTCRYAGGFEWEDPQQAFDQGVDNPFKNPSLMKGEEGIKIDPARLLPPRLAGVNLYLVGLMGSGKSKVGDILARRMGAYNFLDTDDIIEKASGMKIPDIFAAEGEEGFRQVEAQVLDSVYPYVRCVISTGGGIVCKRENWSKLHTGLVVWLDVPPDTIIKRIEGTDRPLLQTSNPLETLQNILNDRREMYGQADLRIEIPCELNEHDVADLVVRSLHDYIDENPPAWKVAKAKAQAEGLDWVK